MEKKAGIKLIGILVISIVASILLTILEKNLDTFSYFNGAIVVFWLWFVDDNF